MVAHDVCTVERLYFNAVEGKRDPAFLRMALYAIYRMIESEPSISPAALTARVRREFPMFVDMVDSVLFALQHTSMFEVVSSYKVGAKSGKPPSIRLSVKRDKPSVFLEWLSFVMEKHPELNKLA